MTIRNLILGSEGFLGRHLCDYLERHGEEVVHYDIKLGPDQDLRKSTLDLAGIDRVYFLAWDVGGSKYLYRPDTQEAMFEWNISILLNTMKQLRNVRFLFVSSQMAAIQNAYGFSKFIGEWWAKKLGGIVVRLWNLYGDMEPDGVRAHVVSDFVRQAVTTGKIRMQTDGSEMRQLIHMEDACRAIHLAMIYCYDEIYDVTSYEWTSVWKMAELVADAAQASIIPGKEPGITFQTQYIGRMPGQGCDTKLPDGIKAMVEAARGI